MWPMKQHQTKKQIVLDLVERCVKNTESVNSVKNLSKDKRFRSDILSVDKLAMKISKMNPKIEPLKFSNVNNKTRRRDSFAFLGVTFTILAVFLGFFGKYLTRPGFYNFKEQDKYAQMLYYMLAILTAFIGVVLYFKYRRTVIKKKSSVSLSTYCYNLIKLKGIVNKMAEDEVSEIFNSI
jgi:hypothetical protein